MFIYTQRRNGFAFQVCVSGDARETLDIHIYRKRRHTNVAMGNSLSPVVPEMPHFNLNQINYMIWKHWLWIKCEWIHVNECALKMQRNFTYWIHWMNFFQLKKTVSSAWNQGFLRDFFFFKTQILELNLNV